MSVQAFKAVAEEELSALYLDYSTAQLAAKFGVAPETVRLQMAALGIPRRSRGGRRTFNPTREELHDLYQEMSMKRIARRFDVGETVVWKRLQEFGIALKGSEQGHRTKTGREFSDEHLANMRKAGKARRGKYVGAANHHWKGGQTAKLLQLRSSGAYREWKRAALALRGGVCQECGVADRTVCECCGVLVKLHVHHVESFARVPERRFDPENSEVLCPKCHLSRHHGKTA